MTPRVVTTEGRLARLGYTDVASSTEVLQRLGPAADPLAHLAAATADPDQAVAYLADLADRVPDRERLLRALVDDEGTSMRLLSVLGASSALGRHLLRHPDHWLDLTAPLLGSTRPTAGAIRTQMLEAVGAEPEAAEPVSSGTDA